jgi:ElaB/YqjD/DUF883 family membrane-anchored ribosome-binding protein
MTDPKTPQEKIASLSAGISGAVNNVMHEAKPMLDRMADRVNDGMHDMAKQGKDAAYAAEHRLEREARHMRTNAQHYIQHEPMKSVLIAAGTGAATALLVSWIMRSRQY